MDAETLFTFSVESCTVTKRKKRCTLKAKQKRQRKKKRTKRSEKKRKKKRQKQKTKKKRKKKRQKKGGGVEKMQNNDYRTGVGGQPDLRMMYPPTT